jgi:hypothetical protein
LNKQVIQCSIDLLIDILAVLLAVCDSIVNQLGVFGLLRCSEDEGGVRRRILGLVLVDSREVTRVAYDRLWHASQLDHPL